MNIADLLIYLDALFSPEIFSDCAPNGLQVGNTSVSVQKIAVAVTADLATLKQAAQLQTNVLIVHHGLFWKGMAYPLTGMIYNRIQYLIKYNIQLIAYHFPLDAHPTLGNNWKVAHDLNWDHLQPFGSSSPYLGVQGCFAPMSIETFIELLTNYYQATLQGKALGGPKTVSSAAIISGGAYRELTHAAARKIDCFISGNFDEPAWSMALENQINFLAFGHTATEKIGPKTLAEYLKINLGIPTVFIDTINPF
ncbi:Nif3-like dinuclear metal center hexameric protein [Candidatus Chlamydia sanziniae]|uniref:GTP cyclohydrolase 1 type 2 homolog n=1 Tax=Candidatus Chlamydia sanziniae TaxID=1806891 RepID=A0A1A9HYB5_9CHLA|nr:Nif3-like dinuclear metal center hexameric protein [Candidatus Chlamydia sanziniae]ANH78916.1 ACR family [Candidatus Chlamydia sanziniae]